MDADPRQILGLDAAAGDEEVVRAWHEAAKIHHPDRGGDPERFRLMRWAYETLTGRTREPAPRVAPRRGADRRRVLEVPVGVALAGGHVVDALGRQVQVPADCGPGEELRLVGLGAPGNPAGDLVYTLEVVAAEPWSVEGLDVLGPLPVTWLELYRGRAVALRLPGGGEATVPVPAGSRPGDVVTLEGLGLRGDDGEAWARPRGDLRLEIVAIPPAAGDATLESVLLRLQHGAGDQIRAATLDLLSRPPQARQDTTCPN